MSGASYGSAWGLVEDTEKSLLQNQMGDGGTGVKRRKKLSAHLHLPSGFIPYSTRELDRGLGLTLRKCFRTRGLELGAIMPLASFYVRNPAQSLQNIV